MTRLDSQRRYNDLVQSGSSADGPANQEAGGNATGGDSNRDASTTSRSSQHSHLTSLRPSTTLHSEGWAHMQGVAMLWPHTDCRPHRPLN
jgi:hypothetical protein